MSIFQSFGKKVGGMAQNVAKKSGDMVEVTKININISSEEDNIATLYTKIGKYCYERFEKNGESDKVINELCRKIKSHNNTIETLNEKINEIKNIVKCKECENELSRDSSFCGKCGAKIEIKQIQTDVLQESSIEVQEVSQTQEIEEDQLEESRNAHIKYID